MMLPCFALNVGNLAGHGGMPDQFGTITPYWISLPVKNLSEPLLDFSYGGLPRLSHTSDLAGIRHPHSPPKHKSVILSNWVTAEGILNRNRLRIKGQHMLSWTSTSAAYQFLVWMICSSLIPPPTTPSFMHLGQSLPFVSPPFLSRCLSR